MLPATTATKLATPKIRTIALHKLPFCPLALLQLTAAPRCPIVWKPHGPSFMKARGPQNQLRLSYVSDYTFPSPERCLSASPAFCLCSVAEQCGPTILWLVPTMWSKPSWSIYNPFMKSIQFPRGILAFPLSPSFTYFPNSVDCSMITLPLISTYKWVHSMFHFLSLESWWVFSSSIHLASYFMILLCLIAE